MIADLQAQSTSGGLSGHVVVEVRGGKAQLPCDGTWAQHPLHATSKHEAQGLGGDEIERRLFWDATAFDLMKKWRAVHLPITLAFGVLGLGHILTILLFWQWR